MFNEQGGLSSRETVQCAISSYSQHSDHVRSILVLQKKELLKKGVGKGRQGREGDPIDEPRSRSVGGKSLRGRIMKSQKLLEADDVARDNRVKRNSSIADEEGKYAHVDYRAYLMIAEFCADPHPLR